MEERPESQSRKYEKKNGGAAEKGANGDLSKLMMQRDLLGEDQKSRSTRNYQRPSNRHHAGPLGVGLHLGAHHVRGGRR